uniref:Ion transport domain-containing protein n=1 Tax=Hucho hucho TaxID=62062 RepID=A0A4W5JSS6_9TELE
MWDEMRKKLWGIVESKYFNRGIMIAILINTISMGIEHHNQPEELTNVLEISNIVFTSMFTLEMILKLTAFGFFAYLRNPYNIFDGIIVIIRSGGLPNMTTECYQNVPRMLQELCYRNVTRTLQELCYQNVTRTLQEWCYQNSYHVRMSQLWDVSWNVRMMDIVLSPWAFGLALDDSDS